MTKPGNARRIWTAGLMRCCIATIRKNDKPSEEGDVLQCAHNPESDLHRMVVGSDGRWASPDK